MTIKVLFVCLGNICRSPMAEALFQDMVNKAGLADVILVDSAGTGSWHVGEQAHPGTRRVLQEHGVSYNGHARQVQAADLHKFDYIIGMDESNLNDLERRFGPHPHMYRLLEFAGGAAERDVPDPYYSGNFEYVYQLVEDGCRGLLETIRKQEGI